MENKPPAVMILLLLHLAGDIELKPGPNCQPLAQLRSMLQLHSQLTEILVTQSTSVAAANTKSAGNVMLLHVTCAMSGII